VVAIKDHLSGMTFHDLVFHSKNHKLKPWGESLRSVLCGAVVALPIARNLREKGAL